MPEVVKPCDKQTIHHAASYHGKRSIKCTAIGIAAIIAIAIASTWVQCAGYRWKNTLMAFSRGHIFVVKYGCAISPTWDYHRIDPRYEDLIWDRILVWQIADTSWGARTIIPIWPLMVLCFVGAARITASLPEFVVRKYKIIVETVTRSVLILSIFALGYGPVDRWLAGIGSLNQINWAFYAASKVLSLIVVGVWAGKRMIRELRAMNGCCNICGYDLKGNLSGMCPECGIVIASKN